MIITKKGMDMLAPTSVEFNYLGTLARMKILITPARPNQVNQQNNFNNAPVGRVATAMKRTLLSVVVH